MNLNLEARSGSDRTIVILFGRFLISGTSAGSTIDSDNGSRAMTAAKTAVATTHDSNNERNCHTPFRVNKFMFSGKINATWSNCSALNSCRLPSSDLLIGFICSPVNSPLCSSHAPAVAAMSQSNSTGKAFQFAKRCPTSSRIAVEGP